MSGEPSSWLVRMLQEFAARHPVSPVESHPAPHTPPETHSRAGDAEEDDRE